MPGDHRLRLDDHHRIKTARPKAIQYDPENSVQAHEWNSSRAVAFKNFQLMTQSYDLELQRSAATEVAEKAIEEIKQDLSHGLTLRDITAKD
jgi:hypothetical protein